MRLFTYKMTYDSGFAPNPFYGVLTLATCKPGIRQTKKIGDWVAGFSSQELTSRAANQSDAVTINENALIYLGKVSEILTIGKYFLDSRFKNKIPHNAGSTERAGDNIYKNTPIGSEVFIKIDPGFHHSESDMPRDLSGKNVLIFEEFYYLGRNGKPIPKNILISLPKGPSPYGYKTESDKEINQLIGWLNNNFKKGFNAMPCIMQKRKCGGCV